MLCQARQEAWNGMSRNGRAWFAWPPSGRARDPDPAEFEKPVPDRGVRARRMQNLSVRVVR